ncbi:MAG: PilZ domain-containing protein [Deltaproteobacteria bacterium]|nr:PilZ domain-containing protein [Deltaproteobacteria bacterium]
MNQEKRRNPRIDTHNLISYTLLEEGERGMTQGMGRTLDVSEGGIRLETHVILGTGASISLSIALEDDLIDLQGRIVHCRESGEGRYDCGIRFEEMEEEKTAFLRQYITIFKGEDDTV